MLARKSGSGGAARQASQPSTGQRREVQDQARRDQAQPARALEALAHEARAQAQVAAPTQVLARGLAQDARHERRRPRPRREPVGRREAPAFGREVAPARELARGLGIELARGVRRLEREAHELRGVAGAACPAGEGRLAPRRVVPVAAAHGAPSARAGRLAQGRAQLGQRVEHARLDRADRYVEQLGDVGVGELAHDGQLEGRAVHLGELGERGAVARQVLGGLHASGEVDGRGRDVDAERLARGAPVARSRERALGRPGAAPAVVVDPGVLGDAHHVSVELGARLIGRGALEEAQEQVLGQILGLLGARAQAREEGRERAGLGLDVGLERAGVARAQSQQRIPVAVPGPLHSAPPTRARPSGSRPSPRNPRARRAPAEALTGPRAPRRPTGGLQRPP